MQKSKGSALAYSLIILAIMLFIASSISITTIVEKKSASSTDFSMQAYQTADSGVQLAIKEINKKRSAGEESDPITSIYTNCSNTNLDGSIVAGDSFKLSFFKDEAGTIVAPCSGPISDVHSIKSVGQYKDTIRAVNVAVADSTVTSPACTLCQSCGSNWTSEQGRFSTDDDSSKNISVIRGSNCSGSPDFQQRGSTGDAIYLCCK